MRIHQVIFMGFIAAALIVGCIKSRGKVIRGIVGGVVGFFVPFLFAQIYIWRGGDPTAAGALSFVAMFTVPLGILMGVVVASQAAKAKESRTEGDFQCLECGTLIRARDEKCPKCGWKWK